MKYLAIIAISREDEKRSVTMATHLFDSREDIENVAPERVKQGLLQAATRLDNEIGQEVAEATSNDEMLAMLRNLMAERDAQTPSDNAPLEGFPDASPV